MTKFFPCTWSMSSKTIFSLPHSLYSSRSDLIGLVSNLPEKCYINYTSWHKKMIGPSYWYRAMTHLAQIHVKMTFLSLCVKLLVDRALLNYFLICLIGLHSSIPMLNLKKKMDWELSPLARSLYCKSERIFHSQSRFLNPARLYVGLE